MPEAGVSLLGGGGPDAAPTTGMVLRPAGSPTGSADPLDGPEAAACAEPRALCMAWDPHHRAGVLIGFDCHTTRFLDLGHAPTRVATYELVVRAATAAEEAPVERVLKQSWACATFVSSLRRHVLFALAPGHRILLTSLPMASDARVLKPHELLLRDPDGSRVVVFGRHEAAVTCLASDEEGTVVASGCADGRVRMWGVDGHDWAVATDFLTDEQAHTGAVAALAFTPDGMSLVSAGPDCVRLWDADAGKPLRIFHVDSPVAAVAIAPRVVDGFVHRTLVAGTTQGDLYFWGLDTGELEYLGFHSAPLAALSCRPSGDVLAAGDAAGGVALYFPVGRGWTAAVESSLGEPVVAVAFRAAAPHHLCAVPLRGNAKVWNGTQVPRVPPAAAGAVRRRRPVARFADDVSPSGSPSASKRRNSPPPDAAALRSALKGGGLVPRLALKVAGTGTGPVAEDEDADVREHVYFDDATASEPTTATQPDDDDDDDEQPRPYVPRPTPAPQARLPDPPTPPEHPRHEQRAPEPRPAPRAELDGRFLSRERARRVAHAAEEALPAVPDKEASRMAQPAVHTTLAVRRELERLRAAEFDPAAAAGAGAVASAEAREAAARAALEAGRHERVYDAGELPPVEPAEAPAVRRMKKQLHPRWVRAQALKPALEDACTAEREPVVLVDSLPDEGWWEAAAGEWGVEDGGTSADLWV